MSRDFLRASKKVAICVASYKRPRGLAKLLESIRQLDIEGLAPQLVVIDNDAAGSAKGVFDEVAPSIPFPTHYAIEQARGMVLVHNRLIAEAKTLGAEFVALVDDDQTVGTQWLSGMVKTAVTFDAEIVAPRLLYSFPQGTSSAIRRSFGSSTDAKPTGTRLKHAGSGGTLYRISALDRFDGPFDIRLNLAGGHDTLLSSTLALEGGTIVVSHEAEVTEHMPKSRLNLKWIVSRAWREGSSRSQDVKWINPSQKKSLKWCVLFAGYAAKNALLAVVDAIRYRELPVKRLRLTVFGISGLWHMIFGASKHEEYATQIHGS